MCDDCVGVRAESVPGNADESDVCSVWTDVNVYHSVDWVLLRPFEALRSKTPAALLRTVVMLAPQPRIEHGSGLINFRTPVNRRAQSTRPKVGRDGTWGMSWVWC